ncbi:unnamed protein product [Ilex paraguariensis]|uniref:Uncharacterized protein n=1 Tax=Ilex paraguariensis TaxID=185542 RepID=A0ABC8U5D0_9AQUA
MRMQLYEFVDLELMSVPQVQALCGSCKAIIILVQRSTVTLGSPQHQSSGLAECRVVWETAFISCAWHVPENMMVISSIQVKYLHKTFDLFGDVFAIWALSCSDQTKATLGSSLNFTCVGRLSGISLT